VVMGSWLVLGMVLLVSMYLIRDKKSTDFNHYLK